VSWPDRTRVSRAFDGLVYAPGARFRVVAEGGRLSGWASSGRSSWSGWSQQLHVGDVIVCTGFGAGWGSDPGFGVEFTSEVSAAAGVGSCEFYPSDGGAWSYRPPVGFLEPVVD
jgi:hypothetical protein